MMRTRRDSPPPRLDISGVEISTVTLPCGGSTEDELDLIAMRCQEGLAISNLEEVFAEGRFALE